MQKVLCHMVSEPSECKKVINHNESSSNFSRRIHSDLSDVLLSCNIVGMTLRPPYGLEYCVADPQLSP